MAFTPSRRGDATIVRVDGQLTVGNRHELKSVIHTAIEEGVRKFVLDCAGADYIDSSGLGALVTIAKGVREVGGVIRLSGLNDDLRSLFELTKLDSLFAIHAELEQALAGL